MAKIHGLAFLVVGLIVVIISAVVDYLKLLFFLLTGIIFMIIGAYKVMPYITGHKEKEQHVKTVGQSKAMHKYCAKCGTVSRQFDNFCARCGNRFFHYRK